MNVPRGRVVFAPKVILSLQKDIRSVPLEVPYARARRSLRIQRVEVEDRAILPFEGP